MNYENDYIKVETDTYQKLLENEEYYKKAYSMLRDLLPEQKEIEKIATWQSDDLEGLFEEVDYILRSLEKVRNEI